MQGKQRQLRAFLRKDGWLLGALAAAVAACLLLGAAESASNACTQEEARLARVLSAMEGAGRVEVAVFYEEAEEASVPCGVVVVAQGAQDMAVRLRLARAVSTLTGVDASRVEIFQLKEEP